MFDKLVKKYELIKTLRFELVPVDETKNLFNNDSKNILQEIVEKDQKIDTWYNIEMKPLFDDLHQKFITESLSNTKFEGEILEYLKGIQKLGNNLRECNNKLKDFKKDLLNDANKEANKEKIKKINEEISDIRKKIIDRQQEIRNYITQRFNCTAKLWKEKYNNIEIQLDNNKVKKIKIRKDNYEILNEKDILYLLIHLYPEKIDIIKEFDRFFTYFAGFNENKKNYYSSDAKSTSIANRIVNINFNIFLNNINKYNEVSNNINDNKYIDILHSYNNIFKIENYHDFITQNGIENYNDKISEIRSILNEYNQKVLNNSKSQIYNFEKLQKQIGCKTKQQIGNIENNEDVEDKYLEKVGLGMQIKADENGRYMIWEAINNLNESLINNNLLIDLRKNYQDFFDNYNDYDLSKIWFRKEAINTISSRWFGADNWSLIRDALKQVNVINDKIEHKNVIDSFISLYDIKSAFDLLKDGVNFDIKNKKKEKNDNNILIKYKAENLFKKDILDNLKVNNIDIINKSIFEVFMLVWKNEIDFKFKQIFDGYITEKGNKIEAFLNEYKKYSQETFNIEKKDENNRHIHLLTVKNLIEDGYLSLFQLTKYHSLLKNNELVMLDTEFKFYDTLNKFWDNNKIVLYHKALQATLTKKPYSIDKVKLNFDNGILLQGWSDGQEKNKSGVIIKKNDEIYLGILHDRNLFKTDTKNVIYKNVDNSNIQRLILTSLKKKTILGKGFKNYYNSKYSELNGIDAINKAKEYIKEKYVNKYPKLNEILNKSYNDKKEFSNDLESILNKCYTMKFRNINKEIFDEALKAGKLYLFKVKSKDIKKQNKNTKNDIHMEYWNYLFSDKNFDNINITLNAGAEIFFRKGQKEKLKQKKDKQGKEILDAKRYGEDKYFFHVPITINYSLSNINPSLFNKEVNSIINSKENNTFYVIGIDRGEKHLMYYSVVQVQFDDNNEIQNYKMIEQGSLNKIKISHLIDEKIIKYKYADEDTWTDYNPIKKEQLRDIKLDSTGNKVDYVDYYIILDFYEKKRILAKKSWETIGKIKDIKEGYISQVIHKLYNLIIKYNAVITMENLNIEFKIKRTAKVEKSIYKKFELALAKKLNHVILKDKKLDELGSVLNAYQLTPYIGAGDVSKFEKAKQWGIMFYVNPNYTSSIDPLTGWRKHIYYSNSENIQRIKKIFCGKDAEIKIDFDQQFNCFKFTYFYDGKKWELFAYDEMERFYWDENGKNNKSYKMYDEFKKLFDGLDTSKNINEQLADKFNWNRLIFLWNLLNQIRNTDRDIKDDSGDFIQSPVWSDKYRCFFDSRKVQDINLPKNGDANGAYNIARKGIILLKRIRENPEKFDIFIKDKEWDEFCVTSSI